MKAKPVSSTSIVRILGVVVPIALLLFWWLGMANFLVGRALMIAYPGIEVTSKGAWFEWDGDVTAKQVVILPFEVDDETAIRFERAHVEVPGGWFWFLRNLLDRKLSRARMDRLHLTLEGGSSPSGIEPSLGDLGPFGAVSASPFEAEGCLQDTQWVREELEQMGLQPGPTRLEFDYRIDGTTLLTSVVLETPRASRVHYERRSRIGGSGNALLLDSTPTQVLGERWEVQDQGFVSARNRHCGKKDGIDARRFIERHVATVERLMAVAGLGWNADSRTTYRRFARDGGTLSFGGDYAQPIEDGLEDATYASGEALHQLHARLQHNGRGGPVVWQRSPPDELPGLSDGEATYALMQRERDGGRLPATAPPETADAAGTGTAQATPSADGGSPPDADADAAAAAPAATSPAVASSASAVEPAPATESAAVAAVPPPVDASKEPTAVAAPSETAATSAAPATVAATSPAASVPSAATATAAEITAPAAAAAEAPRPALTAAGAPPLSKEAQARVKVSSNASAPPPTRGPQPGAELEWTQLAGLRGRMVRIWTRHNPPRTVEILSAEGDAIRILTRVGGGNAEYTVQRAAFVRATLIQ